MLISTPVFGQGYRTAEIEFNRGELLLEMKDYPRAIFAFNKAYSIVPDLRYLAGLAKTYYAKGDVEKALVWGEEYLNRKPEAPDAGLLRIVNKLREEFGAGHSKVVFTLLPGGGKLTVVRRDGTREAVVVDGDRLVRYLPVGDLEVIYMRDGFEASTHNLKVTRNKPQQLDVVLAPAKGPCELVIDSNVRGARVYVDGKEVGATPYKQKVEAGDHVLQVWAQNHLAWSGVIAAPAKRAIAVHASLVPANGQVSTLPIPRVVVEEKSRIWRLSTWGWITMGLGVGALGGAGYLYSVFNGKWQKVLAEKDKDKQRQMAADANTYYIGTMASGIVGGAMVSGGLLMVLLDKGEDLKDVSPFEMLTFSPAISPDGVFLDAAWTF
jgi:tetratricopeptide (TPR) repeat protein